MAAWAVGAVVASASGAAAQDALETRNTLTVSAHVTDYANLSPKQLATAETQATAAFRAAGLDLVWSLAPFAPPASPAPDSRSTHVRVVIVPREMAEKKCRAEGLAAGVMGVAISGATEARGRIAYIFYDRIERVALSLRTPVQRGLGHVLAHEIGHLLIGANSHADQGLMRPNWDPRESRPQTFTASQVQTITHRFTATAN